MYRFFYSIFQKNETNPEKLPKYTMYTGENDPYKLSSISSFNGKNSLNIWNSEEGEICNKGKKVFN